MKSKKSHYKYAIRRLKRCSDIISEENLLNSILDSNKNVFDEVRKLRRKRRGLSSRIDENVDPHSIASHFSNIYAKLFNNVNEDEGLHCLRQQLNNDINDDSITTLRNINTETVQTAISSLKPVYDVTSDM